MLTITVISDLPCTTPMISGCCRIWRCDPSLPCRSSSELSIYCQPAAMLDPTPASPLQFPPMSETNTKYLLSKTSNPVLRPKFAYPAPANMHGKITQCNSWYNIDCLAQAVMSNDIMWAELWISIFQSVMCQPQPTATAVTVKMADMNGAVADPGGGPPRPWPPIHPRHLEFC